MPSIPLHPRPGTTAEASLIDNPLPQLLQTPSGLAILEIQGTINIPLPGDGQGHDTADPAIDSSSTTSMTPIGKVMFPDYSPQNAADDSKWMKRVYLYVGRYQRMTGQVQKLAMPLAVIQRRERPSPTMSDMDSEPPHEELDELEIVDIVKYKLLFKTRPEPVNGG